MKHKPEPLEGAPHDPDLGRRCESEHPEFGRCIAYTDAHGVTHDQMVTFVVDGYRWRTMVRWADPRSAASQSVEGA